MKGVFVIDRDLFTASNVAQREKQHVAVNRFHVSVGRAGVVDVVGAVAATTAVQTEAPIDVADTQLGATGTTLCFEIRDSFTGVLSDLSPAPERRRSETTFPVDFRFPDRETGCQLEAHRPALYAVDNLDAIGKVNC